MTALLAAVALSPNASFSEEATAKMRAGTSHTITVRATDVDGLSHDQDIAIAVNNVDDTFESERIVHSANGVKAVAQFDASGVIVSRTLSDPGNATKWSSKTVLYENGQRAFQTITLDDGVVQETSYNDGKPLHTTIVDHDDTRSYHWIERRSTPKPASWR